MVFSEAAYKEVFPDPVYTPAPAAVTKKEDSMLPDDSSTPEEIRDDGIEVESAEAEEVGEDDTGAGDTVS